jgi:hypothetical protein
MGPKFESTGHTACRDYCNECSTYCDLFCKGPEAHKMAVLGFSAIRPNEGVPIIAFVDLAIARVFETATAAA